MAVPGKTLRAVAVLVPVLLYAVLAGRRIAAGVGYQMDEALYVESAVYVLHGNGTPPFVHDAASWLSIGGRQWPLMIIPYVGAVKAYVALPLFAACGISSTTARAAGAFLGGLGIAGLVVLLATQAGEAAALIAGLCLAIHPSYLDFTVFDHGGASVWMGAMGLACLALVGHLRGRSALSAFLLGAAAGLGVWARANFLWLIAAGIAAAAIVYGRRMLPTARELLALGVGGAVGAAPLIVYEIASRGATLSVMAALRQPLSARVFGARLGLMAELMVSARELRVSWGGPGTLGWEVGVGAVLLVLVVLSAISRVSASAPGVSRFRRALALTALILTAILASSRLPVGQHHMVATVPLACGGLVILSVETARRFPGAARLLAAAGVVLGVVWLSWDVRIERGLRRTGGLGLWSSALDDLGRDLASRGISPDRLKILNWGFQNNLYVISGGSVHGTELFWGATAELSSRGVPWSSEVAEGGAFLLFESGTGSPAVAGFLRSLAAVPGGARETVFNDRSGSPVARLVEVAPRCRFSRGCSLPLATAKP